MYLQQLSLITENIKRCHAIHFTNRSDDGIPEFLTIGHVTRDVHTDGSFSLGGTVTFAALTAYHLGLVAAIVTCADACTEC